ncbi:MAG: hypothetical protein OEV31_05590, partial [Gammaproteobacteria bacterium]|nr:hypothetical protein [Gammaproteobacteria bacterium]
MGTKTRVCCFAFLKSALSISRAFTFVAISLLGVSLAQARDLTGIDKLATLPPDAKPVSKVVAEAGKNVHTEPRLGVPTFLWVQRIGPVATQAADIARSAPADPSGAARAYLRGLGAHYSLPPQQADAAALVYTQTLKNGSSIVRFRNQIDGIDVFREEATVLLGADRKLVTISGFLMGGKSSASFNFSPTEAIAKVLSDWSLDAQSGALLQETETRDGYQYFNLPAGMTSIDGSSLNAPVRTKRVWFRLPKQLVPAYYIEAQVNDGTK